MKKKKIKGYCKKKMKFLSGVFNLFDDTELFENKI